MVADCPVELSTDPVDQTGSIPLFVLARGLDFARASAFAPTANHAWQQSQIHLIFVVQVNFTRLGASLQIFKGGALLLVLWVRTAHREHRTLHGVILLIQGASNTAFTHRHPHLLYQHLGEQSGRPTRKVIPQVARITFDQFQQLLQPLSGELGWSSTFRLGDEALQPCLVECMDSIGHHIFTVEEQASDLRDAIVLDRQQDDMTVGFQHRLRRLVIHPLDPLLFFLSQGAHIHFAGSAHLQSSSRGDFALYSMTFPAFVSTFYLVNYPSMTRNL